MPTYAILGATGSTGLALLDNLSKSPKYTVNAYVRSKAKLERFRPGISKSEKVQIFEGDLHDIPLITRCISNVSAIFAVVATNFNVPGMTIAQDTAQIIVAALCNLRTQNPDAKLPRIIVLSSASVNPTFSRELPALVRWVTQNAFSYIYEDLRRAERYLRLHKSWMNATFVQPGALVHDAQQGHAVSLDGICLDGEQTCLGYLDLAAGMIEVADGEGKYDWVGVSVVPTARKVEFEWRLPILVGAGLTFHFLPWTYPITKYLGMV